MRVAVVEEVIYFDKVFVPKFALTLVNGPHDPSQEVILDTLGLH